MYSGPSLTRVGSQGPNVLHEAVRAWWDGKDFWKVWYRPPVVQAPGRGRRCGGEQLLELSFLVSSHWKPLGSVVSVSQGAPTFHTQITHPRSGQEEAMWGQEGSPLSQRQPADPSL